MVVGSFSFARLYQLLTSEEEGRLKNKKKMHAPFPRTLPDLLVSLLAQVSVAGQMSAVRLAAQSYTKPC